MEKIKNAFKPDVQKEAEARKAAEQAEAQEATTSYTSTTETSGSTTTTTTDPNNLQTQPVSSTGTGGGLTEATGDNYGATPGHGITSYQSSAETGAATGTAFHHDDPVGPGVTYGQAVSSSAPQIEQQDLGSSVTSGTFLATGNSTTVPERSVPVTTQVGQASAEGGTHPTFTGNRLDPGFQPAQATQSTTGYVPAATTAVTGAGAPVYQSQQITDNTGTTTGPAQFQEESKLTGLLHRSNPSKLQKEPPAGYTTTAVPVAAAAVVPAETTAVPAETTGVRQSSTSSASGVVPVPAAHETFVKPGYHHEQHIGVDGPIGRPAEVSGAHGTDARRTSTVAEIDKSLDPTNPALLREEEREPTLQERQASLGEGRVIDPHTGLVKNIGKYGTGAGGTDGTPQIQGYDPATQAERLREADELRAANKEITWDKIRESGDGF